MEIHLVKLQRTSFDDDTVDDTLAIFDDRARALEFLYSRFLSTSSVDVWEPTPDSSTADLTQVSDKKKKQMVFSADTSYFMMTMTSFEGRFEELKAVHLHPCLRDVLAWESEDPELNHHIARLRDMEFTNAP